ncbi:MAG: hypothetical protein P8J27_00770 [Mariniblastus sp.]|nr:hypothetical protein [Mariniblastus sp.]
MNQIKEPSTVEPRTPSRRATAKRLNYMIGYFASVLSACLLMMWGVFNMWLNILQYRADSSANLGLDQDWKMATAVVVVTCVVPFLIGLGLLFKSLGSTKLRS